MEIILWLLAAALSVGLAYSLSFSSATLTMGRTLSSGTTRTGLQDAITPPWETNLALMVYASIPVLAIVMWWQFGWISALGALVALLIGSSVVKLALPRPSSEHYRRLILRSMCGRYANYVRDGDALRAGAMKDLLNRAGMDLDAMRGS